MKLADVFEGFGEPGVDVVALDAMEWIGVPALALVAAKTLQHELEHVALPVHRGRSVGKDE